MKTIPLNEILNKSIIFICLILLTSCTKENDDFIEYTYGRSMDPKFPRSGIKIFDNGDVYYCREKMLNGNEAGYDYHTRKYEFFKSTNKIDFKKYKNLMLKNMLVIPKEENYIVPDASRNQMNYKLNNQNYKTYFYYFHLNKKQDSIYNEIWKLKEILKFERTDSIPFSKDLLDYTPKF